MGIRIFQLHRTDSLEGAEIFVGWTHLNATVVEEPPTHDRGQESLAEMPPLRTHFGALDTLGLAEEETDEGGIQLHSSASNACVKLMR